MKPEKMMIADRILAIFEHLLHNNAWDNDEHVVGEFAVLNTWTEEIKDALGAEDGYSKHASLCLMGNDKVLSYTLPVPVPDKLPLRWFVNQYRITREYGGAEEGGWWYDYYFGLETTLCSTEEIANRIMAEQTKFMEENGRTPKTKGRYSVNGGADFLICVENNPPLIQTHSTYQ